MSIKIIYEDEAIIIVDKPANYLAIPDRYMADRPNLVGYLKQKQESIFVVHRLDKETSGVICYAKTAEAHKELSRQFENRTVEKIYTVLVEGRVHQKSGIIDKPIAHHPIVSGKMRIHKNGKPSVTHYKVVEFISDYTLLHADIKTGRTHQIRVHFESIGYPLMIDKLYGRQEAFYLSSLKQRKYKLGKDQEERPLMSRSTLHASRLSLDHPVTGERMVFESELPKDFRAVVKQMRKWGG